MPSKKSRIQLYADECFPVTSSTYLKSLGISIIHAYDLNLIEKSDLKHLEEAKKLDRVLITLDRDFIQYEKVKLEEHPGVIVISLGSAVPLNVNKVCDKLLKNIGQDFSNGSLIKVTTNKVIKIKNGKIVAEKKLL